MRPRPVLAVCGGLTGALGERGRSDRVHTRRRPQRQCAQQSGDETSIGSTRRARTAEGNSRPVMVKRLRPSESGRDGHRARAHSGGHRHRRRGRGRGHGRDRAACRSLVHSPDGSVEVPSSTCTADERDHGGRRRPEEEDKAMGTRTARCGISLPARLSWTVIVHVGRCVSVHVHVHTRVDWWCTVTAVRVTSRWSGAGVALRAALSDDVNSRRRCDSTSKSNEHAIRHHTSRFIDERINNCR